MRRGPALLLAAAAAALVAATPAAAQISSPRRERASQGESAGLRLVLGAGFEFSRDDEESAQEYPLVVEWNLAADWKAIVESSYVALDPRDAREPAARGSGDLETFLEGELLAERGAWPALAVEAGVKWGIAAAPELGTGEHDFALGLIASREFDGWDADLGAVYNWIGNPPRVDQQDVFELSLGAEIELGETLSLIGEAVYSFGGASSFRRGGGLGGLGEGGGGFEYAAGFGLQLGERLKAEAGGSIHTDGSWQGILYFEWEFGG